MSDKPAPPPPPHDPGEAGAASDRSVDSVCPVCGGEVIQEKCKVVCRSARCGYRIILTCAEF